jgi:hypothetical protein
MRTQDIMDIEETLYLAANAYRTRWEDFIDEDTGNSVSVERMEIVSGKGTLLTPIVVSMLIANGIENVMVSHEQLVGDHAPQMGLWEVKSESNVCDGRKIKTERQTYIVQGETPSEAEAFMVAYLEKTCCNKFKIVKIVPAEYNNIVRLYERDSEKLEHSIHWFKVELSAWDDSKLRWLVQSNDFEKVTAVVKMIYTRMEQATSIGFTEVKLLNIEHVFVEEKLGQYYSLSDLP